MKEEEIVIDFSSAQARKLICVIRQAHVGFIRKYFQNIPKEVCLYATFPVSSFYLELSLI